MALKDFEPESQIKIKILAELKSQDLLSDFQEAFDWLFRLQYINNEEIKEIIKEADRLQVKSDFFSNKYYEMGVEDGIGPLSDLRRLQC